MPLKTQAAPGQAPGAEAKAPPPPAKVPFPRASRMKTNLSFPLGPITLGAAGQPFGPIQIPANGFMRALTLEFTVTSTGNSAAVALAGDSPFSLLQQLQVVTSSGDTLIVPLDGYALAMAIKYGAFGQQTPYCDPRSDPTFADSATGAGATAGSMVFALRIPFEIDASSGYGSIPNLSSNRSYSMQGIFNALAQIYATPPNGTVTVSVVAIAEYWTVPNDTNSQGQPQETAPYGNGSYHVLQTESINVATGTQLYKLNNVGNVIRELIPIYRNASGVRITWANLPGTIELVLNNDMLFYNTRNQFRRGLAATGYGAGYGAVAAAVNTAQGQDDGVFPFTQFLAPGQTVIRHDGPRNQYLPTLDSTLLQVRGTTWSTAGTLQMVTSAMVVNDAGPLYAPHLW